MPIPATRWSAPESGCGAGTVEIRIVVEPFEPGSTHSLIGVAAVDTVRVTEPSRTILGTPGLSATS